MNLFLQQNHEEIFKEVKGSIENTVADIVKMLLQGPFNEFPYQDIFLPWFKCGQKENYKKYLNIKKTNWK